VVWSEQIGGKMSEGIKITPYISECLDKVAAAEGFVNFDLKIDQGSGVGDGFVGIIIKATIIGETATNV
jgi:hypothetical protein